MTNKIVVVGGVAAGATAAAKARRTDENAEITLIEKGEYISYANCGIPYHLGGVIPQRDKLLLHTPESFGQRFNVKVLVNTEAVQIDTARKQIKTLSHGKPDYIDYDRLILANGAEPVLPPVKGLNESDFFMLRTVTQMDNIIENIKAYNPNKAVIIGGGYIGVETAEALKNCNLDVTVIEALPYILPGFEPETALKIFETMKTSGINIVSGRKATECIKNDNKQLIKLDDGTEIETDLLIISTGVKPDTKLAETAGIEIGALDGIIVNEKMETSIQDIYAAGDMVEKKNIITGKNCLLPLAVPANKEGRTAGCNAAGGDLKFSGVIGTSVVSFRDACVARTGLTYEEAKRHGFKPDYIYVENSDHAEYYPNPKFIFLKLIFDKDSGKILGASASGTEGVTRRIDIISTAIYAGLKVTDLEQLEFCYSPPHGAAKDIVNISGYVASNELSGIGYGITPQQFLATYKNKNERMHILDVRTPAEYRQYHHEKAENIPLKNLRESLKNLDKTRVIYVYCAVGFRGYIAVKILRFYGFEAYNILGGLEALKRFKKL